jgi:hypothetical protein
MDEIMVRDPCFTLAEVTVFFVATSIQAWLSTGAFS